MFKKIGLICTSLFGGLYASAAVDAAVTTAFTTLSADLAAVGALVIVATVGVAVIKYVQAAIV